jgi:hypothetical protein
LVAVCHSYCIYFSFVQYLQSYIIYSFILIHLLRPISISSQLSAQWSEPSPTYLIAVCRKSFQLVLKSLTFYIFQYLFFFHSACSSWTGQNRFTWKTPSSAAFVLLQEQVAVLAFLCSPHANASMKQYECGRTQPLFRAGHDRGKTSGRNLKG